MQVKKFNGMVTYSVNIISLKTSKALVQNISMKQVGT